MNKKAVGIALTVIGVGVTEFICGAMTARDYYKDKIAVLELKNKIQECVIDGFRKVIDTAMEEKHKAKKTKDESRRKGIRIDISRLRKEP